MAMLLNSGLVVSRAAEKKQCLQLASSGAAEDAAGGDRPQGARDEGDVGRGERGRQACDCAM